MPDHHHHQQQQQQQQQPPPPQQESNAPATGSSQEPSFLTVHGVPIYFAENWRSGRIGGGLWSTGLALAKYLGTRPALESLRRHGLESGKTDGITVLELGSGNGFVAVCLAALATAAGDPAGGVRIADVVATDAADHLDQIRATVAANPAATRNVKRGVTVREHEWGCFPDGDGGEAIPSKFDLIVGSDVAYREDLYDVLIESIRHYSHAKTVSLIGVTMEDTTTAFFEKLAAAGFAFQRIADHLLEPEFRGTTFAIFAIRLKRDQQTG